MELEFRCAKCNQMLETKDSKSEMGEVGIDSKGVVKIEVKLEPCRRCTGKYMSMVDSLSQLAEKLKKDE